MARGIVSDDFYLHLPVRSAAMVVPELQQMITVPHDSSSSPIERHAPRVYRDALMR
jgi:hypothetical protein